MMDLRAAVQNLLDATGENALIRAHGLIAANASPQISNPNFAAHITALYRAFIVSLAQNEATAPRRFDDFHKALERLRYAYPQFTLTASAGLAEGIFEIRDQNPALSRVLADILTNEPPPAPEPQI